MSSITDTYPNYYRERADLTTIEGIAKAGRDSGSHFFDADTMRFFSSRLMGEVFPMADGSGSVLFVTSEADHYPIKHTGSNRQYTIRKASWGEDHKLRIDTVGDFQEYRTRAAAMRKAKALAAEYDAWSASLDRQTA